MKLISMSVSNTSDRVLGTADPDFMYSEYQEPKDILIPGSTYFPRDV